MNELTFPLESKSKKPLYEQIYDYIKKEIQQGSIPCYEKLPSTRALSIHLEVSRSTVEQAYDQLLSEGYIESIPCKGYYVCDIEGLYQIQEPGHIANKSFLDNHQEFVHDFSPNAIDLENFPYNAWRKITKNILLEDNKHLFLLGDQKGEYTVRNTISNYLHQARGVQCDPDQIVLGAGADFLLIVLCTILGKKPRIAMESPTYRKAYDIFKNQGYTVNVVNTDRQGMRLEELSLTDSDLAYVMPSHQFPLGTVMPIRKRMELLRWASEKPDRFIIEDDHDSEFRYKGKPIPSLQGYDVYDRVIYLGNFSKSIAPSIRISYLVLPRQLLDAYEKRGRIFSSTVSRTDQAVLQEFIEKGYYERHLNKMRAIYRSKHDLLLSELKKIKGIREINGANAGLHILLRFDSEIEEKRLIEHAQNEGVKVYGLSEYIPGKSAAHKECGILLGYAGLDEKRIPEAVAKLDEAWKFLSVNNTDQ